MPENHTDTTDLNIERKRLENEKLQTEIRRMQAEIRRANAEARQINDSVDNGPARELYGYYFKIVLGILTAIGSLAYLLIKEWLAHGG
ncbi:MAG: hypothetical protein AAGI44_00055 [Pseudomonadota bacterium]